MRGDISGELRADEIDRKCRSEIGGIEEKERIEAGSVDIFS